MPIYIGGVAVDMIAGTKTLVDGISLQEKVVSPTEIKQVVTADSAYDALSQVTVEAISSTYVGSAITKKSAATYTPNDETQVISSGVFLSGDQTISPVPTQEKSVTQNGTYTPDSGKYLSKVIVNVPSSGGSAVLGEKTITANGTYNASDDSLDGYSSVNVNVPDPVINLQSKSVTPSETSQTVTADGTYDALGQVTVDAIPSDYIGSSISRKATQTYTPGSSQQVISAGQYLDGNQIISPVSTETKSITSNGTYAPSEGNYFESVTVSVNPTLQSKSVTPTESAQDITADAGYDGLSKVSVGAISSTYIGTGVTRKTAASYIPGDTAQTIAADQYLTGIQTIQAVPAETKSITSNGTYNPTTGKYFSSVTVNVPATTPSLQSKNVTPTESEQNISADDGYDGLSSVNVGAISSSYIGSAVTRKSVATYTPGDSAQIINSGQYLDGDQTITAVPTETKTVNENGTYTATTGKYISSFTVAVPAPSLQSKTATPTESQQTISADSGYDGLQNVIVNAISSSYIGSAVIFQTYYTGSSTPENTLGNDGDIYIKV